MKSFTHPIPSRDCRMAECGPVIAPFRRFPAHSSKGPLFTTGIILLMGLALCACRPSDGGNRDGATAPAGIYGSQGGEKVLAADPAVPDTVLRCRAIDTFYKLSNLRFGQNRFGQPSIFVDYEKVKLGEQDGVALQLRAGDGRRQTLLILGPMGQTQGTLEVKSPFHSFPPQAIPKVLEAYLTHPDQRYGGPNMPEFKVSTSATMGHPAKLTRARNWTAEEIARLSQPPPNYANPNAHPGVGVETPLAGDHDPGTLSKRFVEPSGHLLGLEYRLGEWDQEKCLGAVVPIFSRDQPTTFPDRLLAREGYAVAGIKVQSRRFVDAVQIVFQRLGPDGRLLTADSYTSDWVGFTGQGPEKLLGSDGTAVIGIRCQQGAILNGIALVTAPSKH